MPAPGERALQPGEVRLLANQLMTPAQREEFERELEMNLAISLPGSGRFRANVYLQRGEVSMVVRLIRTEIPSLESLGLPPLLEKLALQDRGLILVVGAAGSGKSTTLAAMLDYRNAQRSGHILCVEDPIEFLHSHRRSIIDQREVGLDTHSFSAALRNVLREAPDVIMIGEIRDAETMQHALHYAETGHLCVATLHGTSAPRGGAHHPLLPRRGTAPGARRPVAEPPGHGRPAPGARRRPQARGGDRADAGHPHVRDLILRDELHELKGAIENALESGSCSFDQSLFTLVEAGRISLADALKFADSRTDLALKIKLERGFDPQDSERKVLRDH